MDLNFVEEIRNYYMNPGKYPEKNKYEIEQAIDNVNLYLKGEKNSKGESIFNGLSSEYSKNTAPINLLIRKTRADEEGVSATRGYKEIYFNEIIQNANDNTTGNRMNICVDYIQEEKEYSLEFEYKDKGFSVENIIGFFNSEIHTKKGNLVATGKHGVGIKALFYFCDELIIDSNIHAEFIINTFDEDGIEKIDNVKSVLKLNTKWDKMYTRLVVKYKKKDNYGEFNVQKLNLLIENIVNNSEIEDVKRFFFSKNQDELVFDVRSLLFTDKNKNKETGIKRINFSKKGQNEELFCLAAEKSMNCVKVSNENEAFIAEKTSVKIKDKKNKFVEEKYYVFVISPVNRYVQNFSMALPMSDKVEKGRRYYETYYIPEANDGSRLNFLINSRYSSIDRRKLTDDDDKKDAILEDIEDNIILVYKYITSEEFQSVICNEWRKEISAIFHKCLDVDDQFVECCSQNNITNRYLAKYKEDTFSEKKYLVYIREEKEPYEKKFIGQTWDVPSSKDFFSQYILAEDSIEYDAENYIDEVKKIYEWVFNTEVQDEIEKKENLQYILNAVGSLKNLVKLRVCGDAFTEKVSEKNIDEWLAKLSYDNTAVPLSVIGRYKLHSSVNFNGIITSASFYEYLFNDAHDGVFANKQKEQFDEKYANLKMRLQELLVNKNDRGIAKVWGYENKNGDSSYQNAEVAFFASWHHKAKEDVYYDIDAFKIYDYLEECNTELFGQELFDLLLERFETESLVQYIKLFGNKIMMVSQNFPSWGIPKCSYNHSYVLKTSRWFKAKCINLNFLRNIHVNSIEKYRNYLEYFLKNKKSWQDIIGKDNYGFKINAEIPYNQDCLYELFDIYYALDIIEKADKYIDLSVNIMLPPIDKAKDEVLNICPEDYRKFIKDTTDIEVHVAQRGKVKAENKSKQQLIYRYEDKIFLLYNGESWQIATVNNFLPKELIIICDESFEWKETICRVLELVTQNKDIVEKCKAYLPNNQYYAIQGMEYHEITDKYHVGNIHNRKIDVSILGFKDMNCKDMKQIITARGNNDNRCCCCGKKLFDKYLVVVQNNCEETKEEYTNITNVVCKECHELLQKSHKETRLYKKEDGCYVEHKCTVQNTHQTKNISLRYRVCDGVKLLWKKPKLL